MVLYRLNHCYPLSPQQMPFVAGRLSVPEQYVVTPSCSLYSYYTTHRQSAS